MKINKLILFVASIISAILCGVFLHPNDSTQSGVLIYPYLLIALWATVVNIPKFRELIRGTLRIVPVIPEDFIMNMILWIDLFYVSNHYTHGEYIFSTISLIIVPFCTLRMTSKELA